MIRYLAMAVALTASASATAKTFNPLAFFTGASRGDGNLKIVFKSRVPIHVESRGTPDGHGGLVLAQTIREGSKPARSRHWVLHPTSPTTLTGTISDNPGPVTGRLVGNSLHLDYMMKGGLQAEQTLTPDASGRIVYNKMIVRRFGLIVARVNETIRKLD